MTSATQPAIDVVEVPASTHMEECRAILNATRQRVSEPSRFEWMYRKNPDGEAIVWILRDGESGKGVGFTAALPRRMSVLGQPRMCWVGADFSVLPRYRTLGLAVKLRRAAKIGIDAGRADFLYAHPNERMAVIHSRVGHSPIGTMIRMARPLRIGALIGERVSSPLFGRACGAVADPILRWTDRAGWSERGLEYEHLLSPVFDSKFDELFSRGGHRQEQVIGVRDAAYLNWRYGANPCYRSEAIVATKRGEVVGYAVFLRDEGSLTVKDIFPSDSADVVAGLLGELRRIGYRDDLQSVSMTLLDSNPIVNVLRSQGFRQRAETSQMFGYCPPDRPWAPAIMNAAQWRVTVGDRDL